MQMCLTVRAGMSRRWLEARCRNLLRAACGHSVWAAVWSSCVALGLFAFWGGTAKGQWLASASPKPNTETRKQKTSPRGAVRAVGWGARGPGVY